MRLEYGIIFDGQRVNTLNILYRDPCLIAIHKPSGLLVHRSKIDRHETRFAMQLLRDQIGQHVFPLHRLDKPTAGVLLFALDSDIARQMNLQFCHANGLRKHYLAIVRGYTPASQHIDYPLQEQLDKMTDRKARQDKAPQAAITDYTRLASIELPYAVGRYRSARFSLLQLTPQTGRKHQLRRHMKHIFHPILGDTTHGDGKQNQLARQRLNCHQLLLSASQLECIHPVSKRLLRIRAPLEAPFQRLLDHSSWVWSSSSS